MSTDTFLGKIYPELDAGGFSSVDGTIEFYGRVNALLVRDMVALDFGAGRAAWFEDDKSAYRNEIRLLKGKVKKVIACDVDPAVLENRSVDEAFVAPLDSPLPLEDGSIDFIVSDYVFEHVTDPSWIASEFERILRPGGWICARTPTKYCYVSLVARLVRNSRHSSVLKRVQPDRKERDVFPTAYRLNSLSEISNYFSSEQFDNFSYLYVAEPAYHFNNAVVFRVFEFIQWIMPKAFSGNLFVFLRKK